MKQSWIESLSQWNEFCAALHHTKFKFWFEMPLIRLSSMQFGGNSMRLLAFCRLCTEPTKGLLLFSDFFFASSSIYLNVKAIVCFKFLSVFCDLMLVKSQIGTKMHRTLVLGKRPPAGGSTLLQNWNVLPVHPQPGVTNCKRDSSRLSLVTKTWLSWSLMTLKNLKLVNFCDVSAWLHQTEVNLFILLFLSVSTKQKVPFWHDTLLFLRAECLPCHRSHVTESSDTQLLIPRLVSDMPQGSEDKEVVVLRKK